MMIASDSFKLSLAPFHLWTPDVYHDAHAPVTHNEVVRLVLAIIAFAFMLFGNLMALSQSNIKRVLGYSFIAHLGY